MMSVCLPVLSELEKNMKKYCLLFFQKVQAPYFLKNVGFNFFKKKYWFNFLQKCWSYIL
jgi:hypothetical protein